MKYLHLQLPALCAMAILAWLPGISAGAAAPIPASVLAEKLGLARDSITVEDVTAAAREKYGNSVISAHRYLSSDRTAPKLTAWVCEPGMVWTEKFQNQIQTALERARSEGVTNVPIQRFSFGDRGEGVYRLAGFGALGMEFEITATFPAQARELRLKAVVSNDSEDKDVSDVPDTRSDEMLRNCFLLIGQAITGTPVEMRWSDAQAKAGHGTNQPTNRETMPSHAGPNPNTAALPSHSTSSKAWLSALGFASLALIAWVFLKGRGR